MAAGWQLYRLSPGMWTLLVFTWWILIAVFNQIPYVGPIATTVALPAFMMGFMAMCEELRHGRPLRPALLFVGFSRRLPALFGLGALYLLAIFAILAVSSVADRGALFDWMMWAKTPPEEVMRDGSLYKSFLIAAILSMPVFAAFWFAPILAAWDGMSAVKSLFYSFFACLRNWRAFLVYGVVVTLYGMAFSVFVTVAAMASGGHPAAVRGFMLAGTLILLPALFASFYVAYRDIFSPPDAPQPTAPA